MAPGLDLRFRTLAHEIGHVLDNGFDNNNPKQVYYPANFTGMDDAVNTYRRITHATEQNARAVRPAGNLAAVGNRMLKNWPAPAPLVVPSGIPAGGGTPEESSTGDSTAGSGSLTNNALSQTILAAESRWATIVGADTLQEQLSHTRFVLSDLPGTYLGLTSKLDDGTWQVVIDPDAAGYGWFIDATPAMDEEFTETIPGRQFQATPGSPAAQHIDLFTAVMHEIGHVLRLPDLDDGQYPLSLMTNSLAPGERRVPSASDPVWAILDATPGLVGGGNLSQPHGLQVSPPNYIVNGGFDVSDPSSSQFGWQTVGSATVASGVGVLEENAVFNSRFSQTFTIPVNAESLQFTFRIEGFETGTNSPPDAFEMALLDATTYQPLVGVLNDVTGTDALLNIQADGTTYFGDHVTVAGVATSGDSGDYSQTRSVLVSLSGITPGTTATLYFDLLGFGAVNGRVFIDNVALVSSGNNAPTDLTLGNTTVPENAAGADIGSLTVTDPDVGDSFTFVVSDDRFEVVGGVLKLKSGMSLDHESEPIVPLTITATDSGGLPIARDVTITVSDVNETPTSITLTGSSVVEQVPGAEVGTLAATDPDVGDPLGFSVINDTRFEVVGDHLKLKDGVSLLYTDASSVVVDVRVTDSGGLSLTRSFVIEIAPVAAQVDVTSLVTVTYYGTQFNRVTRTTSFYGTITNTSDRAISGPLWLAFDNLTPTTVQAVGIDGHLSTGSPYYDLTGLTGDGILNPGETTTARHFSLYNPTVARYSFENSVLGVLPTSPETDFTRIFLDFDGGLLPELSDVVAVSGSTGMVHPGFVPFGSVDREEQIQRVVEGVRADFAPYPVQVLRDDTWQLNPRFGAGDTVILVGGDGSWLVGTNPITGATPVQWTAGYAPWDPGNQAANVGLAFSAASAQALSLLGGSEPEFVQQLINTISHEAGHTFGLDHATATSGTPEMMQEINVLDSADGVFSAEVLPREHGATYSSDSYLRSVFGLSSTPLPSQTGSGSLPQIMASQTTSLSLVSPTLSENATSLDWVFTALAGRRPTQTVAQPTPQPFRTRRMFPISRNLANLNKLRAAIDWTQPLAQKESQPHVMELPASDRKLVVNQDMAMLGAKLRTAIASLWERGLLQTDDSSNWLSDLVTSLVRDRKNRPSRPSGPSV